MARAQTGLQADALSRRSFLSATALSIGGLGLLSLTGCGSSGSSGSEASNGVYKGKEIIGHEATVVTGAVFYIAQEKGLFKAAKLALDDVDVAGGEEIIRLVMQQAPLGMPGGTEAIISHEKGADDLRIVSGLMNVNSIQWIVPADSSLTMKDLKGKKIGVSRPDSLSTYNTRMMIKKAGLTEDDVKVVFIGGPPDAWTAAQHGVIDVAWSAAPYSSGLINSGKAKVFADGRDVIPHFISNFMVSTSSFLDSNGAVVRRWLGALQKSIDLIRNDVDEAGRIYAKATKLPVPVATKALKDYQDGFSLDIDMTAAKGTIDGAVTMGKLPERPDIKSFIDDRFLPKAASK